MLLLSVDTHVITLMVLVDLLKKLKASKLQQEGWYLFKGL